MSEQPFADDELYEIRKDALHVRNNPVLYDDKHVKDAEIMLRLVAVLRAAGAENEQLRGIIEGLEDANAGRVKTFNTIDEMLNELNASAASSPDRSAASDEATGGF